MRHFRTVWFNEKLTFLLRKSQGFFEEIVTILHKQNVNKAIEFTVTWQTATVGKVKLNSNV